MSQIMLFPLSSVVLPEGKMKLRIFEPRYKRMIAECLKAGTGFGLCLVNNDAGALPHNTASIGTFVSIVDFETLDDGLLGITVSGIKRFKVEQVSTDFDGLRHADVTWLPTWQPKQLNEHHLFVGERLQAVYKAFPLLGELYTHCFFDDATWVSQRWIEVLPVTCSEFEKLALQQDCDEMLDFVEEMITVNDSQKATI